MAPGGEQRLNTVSDGSQTSTKELVGSIDVNTSADATTGTVDASATAPRRDSYEAGSAVATFFDLQAIESRDAGMAEIRYSVAYDVAIGNTDDGMGNANFAGGILTVSPFDVTDQATAFVVDGTEESLLNAVRASRVGARLDPITDDFVFDNLISRQRGGLGVMGTPLAVGRTALSAVFRGANDALVDDSWERRTLSGTVV